MLVTLPTGVKYIKLSEKLFGPGTETDLLWQLPEPATACRIMHGFVPGFRKAYGEPAPSTRRRTT